RVGTPRHVQLLGISGSLALAGGVDLRHGDLSDIIRALSHAPVSLVLCRISRLGGRLRGGRGLRAVEYCRRTRGFYNLALAFLRALRALSFDRGYRAIQIRSPCPCCH